MKSNTFSPRLEAIRGIAALMVAISHSMGAVLLTTPVDHWLQKVSNLPGNGAAAVTIFFVLSGHVLGLSLKTSTRHPIGYWPVFMLRRVLRIYPAMVLCLTVCAVYLAWFYVPAKFTVASNAYYNYWHFDFAWNMFFRNVFLMDNRINSVTWTLQVEFLGAIALPFFYFIKTRYPFASHLLLTAWLLYFLTTPLYIYGRTGFLYMFLVGLYVTDLSYWLRSRLSPSKIAGLALISGVACCLSNHVIPETKPLGWIIESVLAYVLLAAIFSLPSHQKIFLLDRREVRFLGKVSYSFYLWHFPVLYVVATEIFRVIDSQPILAHPLLFQWTLFAVTSLIALTIAALSYKYIEQPCKNLFRTKKTQSLV